LTPRDVLKAATAEAHDRLDAHFATYDLAQRDDYERFLAAHAAAFLPAEQALTDAGAASLVEEWDEHRRTDALLADLEGMDLSVPTPIATPIYGSEAAVIGGLYVLEGSRLGGAVLRRQVGEFPHAFLDAVHAPGRWPTFIALATRKLYDPRALEEASAYAIATFGLFEMGAREGYRV